MRVKAAVLRQIGLPPPYAASKPLAIAELDLSSPGRGEVLVGIKAAGLCHSDSSVIDGSRPRPTPIALGHEAAGIVEAVGEGVTDLEAGDHVVLVFVPSCGRCLWDYWTAPGFTDEEHLAQVKRMLAVPGALEATLGYYRAMFDPARADPDLAEVRQAAGRPIVVPTLALCGAEDKRAEVMQGQARHFAGPYRFELVPGSSHFLQREQPQAVSKLVLDWFARQ